jgi:hypothetical protein
MLMFVCRVTEEMLVGRDRPGLACDRACPRQAGQAMEPTCVDTGAQSGACLLPVPQSHILMPLFYQV